MTASLVLKSTRRTKNVAHLERVPSTPKGSVVCKFTPCLLVGRILKPGSDKRTAEVCSLASL